jgi:hypothetical protein
MTLINEGKIKTKFQKAWKRKFKELKIVGKKPHTVDEQMAGSILSYWIIKHRENRAQQISQANKDKCGGIFSRIKTMSPNRALNEDSQTSKSEVLEDDLSLINLNFGQ